jgi:hypothetical protein
MSRPAHLIIDGKAYSWRELVERRKAQLKEAAIPEQPALFELKLDCRVPGDRTAADRYREPSLFSLEPG